MKIQDAIKYPIQTIGKKFIRGKYSANQNSKEFETRIHQSN